MEGIFHYLSQPVYYRDLGEGYPVVLLHGFGEDSNIWNDQIKYLEGHCRLIVPDLPGSGRSTIANGDYPIIETIEAMADCVVAFIRSITQQPVILLGHSMGGYITLAIAEKTFIKRSADALPLSAFGLIHSTAFADTEEKKATRRKAISFIKAKGGSAFLQTAIPGLFGEVFLTAHADKVAALTEAGKYFKDEALIAYYEAMIARPDRTAALKSSGVPVLFIIGREDKAAPLADVMQQVSLPDVSYVHVLPTGHMSMLEATEPLNQHLLEFVKDIEKQ